MVVASTEYSDTLNKIEILRANIKDLETNIYSQISLGITNEFDRSKKDLLNWLEEIEYTLSDNKEK